MIINSAATLVDKPKRPYSDFGTDEPISWIQAPISRAIFEEGFQIIDDIYVQVKPVEFTLPIPKTLAQEFAAWDAASDEALTNFERENL
jgi:hypothetical protein